MILLYGSTAWTQVKPSTGRIYFSKLGDKSRRQNFKRYPAQTQILFYLFITFFIDLPFPSFADVGVAAQYSPPYLPTGCYGGEALQFPSSNLFAAAGDGIWDNGAACGRQYLVRCISAEKPRTCIPQQSIQVKIVDYAFSTVSTPSATGTTMVLSQKAFQTIANSSAALINIEFQQV